MSGERGFLTEGDSGDEAYITDPETDWSDTSTSTLRDKRSRIRNRIREALLDFSLLLEHYPAQERKEVFSGEDVINPERTGHGHRSGQFELEVLGGAGGFENATTNHDGELVFIQGDEELLDAVADTIAFLWLGCYHAQVNPTEVVEVGAERALERMGRTGSAVTVDTITLPERKEQLAVRGRKKMASGEELTNAEATALVEKEEELVPNGLVFDYLRGEVDQFNLEPFPGEEAE